MALFHQVQRQVDGAHLLHQLLGNFGPDEHRCLGRFGAGPAQPLEPSHQRVAPLLVDDCLAAGELIALSHGDDRGNLNGLEDAVVVVALDLHQGPAHLGVARAEAHPPAGHVVGLAHGGQLDGHLLGSAGLQKTRRPVIVETRLAVSEIVQHQEAESLGHLDHFFVELDVRRDHGRRIVRIVQHQNPRPREKVLGDHLDTLEELLIVAQGDADDVALGQGDGVDVNEKRRVGHNGRVARPHQRKAHVRKAFLRADGRDHLGGRIEVDAVQPLVLAGQFAAQIENADRLRVTAVARIEGRLAELGHDRPGHRVVGVAHP